MSTKIEWADITINPVVGCSKCSPGCDNCYAERLAARWAKHPEWARSLRDQCKSAGAPFFFKGWGEWRPVSRIGNAMIAPDNLKNLNKLFGKNCHDWKDGVTSCRVGKKIAGRLLAGEEHNEFPEVTA